MLGILQEENMYYPCSISQIMESLKKEDSDLSENLASSLMNVGKLRSKNST